MSEEKTFQKRISYKGDLALLLIRVCREFKIGDYESYHIITVGYEDLNIFLRTSIGVFLIKVLADFRSKDDRLRYSEIIQEVSKSGIATSQLYKSDQGYLHTIVIDESAVHLFVMQFIDGHSFYELGLEPTRQEIKFLSRQAALINQITARPKYVYDDWAIVNFTNEYQKIKTHLNSQDVSLLEPLASEFTRLDVNSFPHCFVHGDITRTNVLKDNQNQLWIVDYSVANYNPRIQELAVFCCSLLFDQNNPGDFDNNYQFSLAEYEQVLNLTQLERESLPIFIRAAHAMHIIGATRSRCEATILKKMNIGYRPAGLVCLIVRTFGRVDNK